MTTDSPEPPAPGGAPQPQGLGHFAWGVIILVILVAVIMMTTRPVEIIDEPVVEPVAEIEDNANATPAPEPLPPLPESRPENDAHRTTVSIESLADQQEGWLTITAQSVAERSSSAEAKYRRNNEFNIDTSNVDCFEVDLSELPVTRTRRFIMHIDGQNMLLFPEQMGVVSFRRSPEGTWAYEDR